VPAGLGDGDDDTLDSLSPCTSGQIAKYNGSIWSCQADVDILGGLNCASGEVAKSNGAGGWSCQTDNNTDTTIPNTDTLADLSCETDQIAKWDGLDWFCADVPGVTGPKTVFVTSTAYPGDLRTAGGALNGLTGGDKLCQAAADAGKVQPGFYIAWLSTFSIDASDRLPANTSGYYLPSGLKVADSKADLLDGGLLNPIDEDENGGVLVANVWTGTRSDGRGAPGSQTTCTEWTEGTSFRDGLKGSTAASNGSWTDSFRASCGGVAHLYCFER